MQFPAFILEDTEVKLPIAIYKLYATARHANYLRNKNYANTILLSLRNFLDFSNKCTALLLFSVIKALELNVTE